MLSVIKGIVLHHVKYGESSVIATIYTREFGRQSYIVSGIHSKKSESRAGMLQPLFLVELVAYMKQSRDVQRIKEMKNVPAYQNLPFDVVKSTQAIFLAEILYKTLMEQEGSPEMFDFIQNALLYFDLMEKGSANFHLFFLLRLSAYLGFLPDTRQIGYEGWFDLKKGAIVPFEPSHPFFAKKDATPFISALSNVKIQELQGLKIPSSMREYLLAKLTEYYHFHFQNLSEIKSLKILKDVFS